MRITSKGQVTIPQDVRERHGLLPGTEVEFVDEGNAVRLRKTRRKAGRGRRIVERLHGSAAASSIHLSTDEIMALTRGDN